MDCKGGDGVSSTFYTLPILCTLKYLENTLFLIFSNIYFLSIIIPINKSFDPLWYLYNFKKIFVIKIIKYKVHVDIMKKLDVKNDEKLTTNYTVTKTI